MTATSTPRIANVPRGALPWWLLTQTDLGKAVLILENEEDVLGVLDDLNALLKLPRDWGLPAHYAVSAYPADDEPARQVGLYDWLFGKAALLIVSREGMELPVDEAKTLRDRTFKLKPGLTINRRAFEERLAAAGYSRSEFTDQVGEYAIRGDVIDIWPPAMNTPVRIVWNIDTIEALRPVEVHSQRSEGFLAEVILYPVVAGQAGTLRNILPAETTLIEFAPGAPNAVESGFENPPLFHAQIPPLIATLKQWHDEDWRVAVFCHNRGERDRLEELLVDPLASAKGLRAPWIPPLFVGELEHGFVNPVMRVAVLANSEIFGRYRKRVRLPKFEGGGGFSSPLDIKTNDFLVHEKHGIGRYQGLRSLKVGTVTSEYLSIEYKGGDKIYVPIFEIQQVQKYLGAEGRRPALSSLDRATWERVKSKVKEDVAKLAAELLRKAAHRTIRRGHAFPPMSKLESEFAASFVYTLTRDQVKTLEEVEGDMMAPRAMDRLVCGDVGFGKTEIAMRAALKCALSGKQVAFLCPTTILAEQHARNLSERFADYPVTVRFVSRFQTKQEQKQILEAVSNGGVDVIIGTHRLLSADVKFKNVGLIIIDEEHRFGVKQKTKLLNLRETADVLSLTATPIPRTLASALGGIKDLSVIETAPEGRLPISTHVGEFNEDVMAKAVQQELDRGGQVFYVHNRVKTLLARKKWLEGLMPSVRIVMAHGQMNEHELEEAMHGFLHRKYDILLSTTIIESGLDIPSTNTLIVEEAEELGLSQLYQLRGRVGRSRIRAYCYLFYSSSGMMTTDARKRLEALREFTSLGSGLKLAMRDMEIRGAGNLLGPQQHGNMAAVGIETYSSLLNEEISRLKGEPVEEDKHGPLMEMSLSAYIPEEYMPVESERVQTYKRILSAPKDQLAKLKEELVDRCGPLPEPAQTIFDAAFLRLIAAEKGLSEVHEDQDDLLVYFRPKHQFSDDTFQKLMKENGQSLSFVPGSNHGVRLPRKEGESGLDALGRFIRLLS